MWLHGQPVPLTTQEFELLSLLAHRAGELVSRDEVFRTMRGIDYDGLDRSIDGRVSKLRRKLGDDAAAPTRIKTVWGKGGRVKARPETLRRVVTPGHDDIGPARRRGDHPAEVHDLRPLVPFGMVEEREVVHGDHRGRRRAQRHRVVGCMPHVGGQPPGDARRRRPAPKRVATGRRFGASACSSAAGARSPQRAVSPRRVSRWRSTSVPRGQTARERDGVDTGTHRSGGNGGNVEQHAHGGSLRSAPREGLRVDAAVALGAAVPVELLRAGDAGAHHARTEIGVVEDRLDLARARLGVARGEQRAGSCTTSSSAEPVVVTVGIDRAIASTAGRPKPSYSDARQNASARR